MNYGLLQAGIRTALMFAQGMPGMEFGALAVIHQWERNGVLPNQ